MGASLEWSARTRRPDERFPARGAACVIEPDDAVREQVSSVLCAMGFTTHETACGRLGAFIASQIHLHAIVTDLALPDIKGLKLIRRLRRAAPELIIIAVAPQATMAPALALARFAGADAVLALPPSREALGTAITAAERRGEQSWVLARI